MSEKSMTILEARRYCERVIKHLKELDSPDGPSVISDEASLWINGTAAMLDAMLEEWNDPIQSQNYSMGWKLGQRAMILPIVNALKNVLEEHGVNVSHPETIQP